MRQFVLILAVCLAGVYCGVGIEYTNVSPSERAQGFACKSHSKYVGLMKAGEEKLNFKPNHCGAVQCKSNGEIMEWICSPIGAPPGCKIVENNPGLFPDCCAKVVC